jgi:hypothetical protein
VRFDAACAPQLSNSSAELDTIPSIAAEAIRVWAVQRGVSLASIQQRGGVLSYGTGAAYCFRFANDAGRYSGVVCVNDEGTVLAEDSRASR